MALRVVNQVTRFPGTALDGGVLGTDCPGFDPQWGSNVLLSSASGFQRDPVASSLDQGSQRISVPNGGRGLRAISMHPASAIHECDISIGGSVSEFDRHRIGFGNPLQNGELDGRDFVHVSLPESVPFLAALPINDNFCWDCIAQSAGGGIVWGWPLRLQFWYDDAGGNSASFPQMNRGANRTSLRARARISLTAGTSRTLTVLTGGRSSLTAHIVSNTANTSIKIDGQTNFKTVGNSRIDTAQFKNLLPVTAVTGPGVLNTQFTDNTFRYTAVQYTVSDTAGTGAGFIELQVKSDDVVGS